MSVVENRIVVSGSVHLNVFDWGMKGKPPLVLLHGLASTCHMFDLLAPVLAADYHVIAFDQRGHGLSDKPDGGYDFETIARDLDGLIAALGFEDIPVMLAGHSWGASTVLYYAATRPQNTEKIILLDGGLRPVTDIFANLEDMAPPQYRQRSLADVQQMIRKQWLRDAWRPELEPLVLTIYDLSDPANVQPHLKLARHMQIAQSLWNFHPSDYFALTACPILIVNAIQAGDIPDAQLLAYAAQVQQENSRVEIVQMPNTIHDIPWQRPHELAAILRRFLFNGTFLESPEAQS